jgi:hypothetical protein
MAMETVSSQDGGAQGARHASRACAGKASIGAMFRMWHHQQHKLRAADKKAARSHSRCNRPIHAANLRSPRVRPKPLHDGSFNDQIPVRESTTSIV